MLFSRQGRDGQHMNGTVLLRYEERLGLAEIESDSAQRDVAARLGQLQQWLQAAEPNGGVLAKLFRSKVSAAVPRGLYIHGPVGSGKTMLMDLFFEETRFEPKRRAHFHAFMADIHDRIGDARSLVPGDPIPHVAEGLAREAKLFCFDELHVSDIADAMILGRLFEALFAHGVVVVSTSNAPPSGLYKNGLNRQLFLPFIDLIEAHMDIIELRAAKDFRLAKLSGAALYFTPNTNEARAELDRHWTRLTGAHPGRPAVINFKGRQLNVPLASMGVARFSFADLCDQPLGSLDYLHIAHAYHTVILDDIPMIERSRRDRARRFTVLIDTLYDSGVCLIASAETEPSGLFPAGDEAGYYERTVSRLMEMRSEKYVASRAAKRA